MPATVTVPSKVRHEEFCIAPEPRLEVFDAYSDDEKTGRSRPTHTVTRCIDCGAATYKEKNPHG